jgi:hypothetical protein
VGSGSAMRLQARAGGGEYVAADRRRRPVEASSPLPPRPRSRSGRCSGSVGSPPADGRAPVGVVAEPGHGPGSAVRHRRGSLACPGSSVHSPNRRRMGSCERYQQSGVPAPRELQPLT